MSVEFIILGVLTILWLAQKLYRGHRDCGMDDDATGDFVGGDWH